MAAAASARPYQVVVWGASGFTGKLVCEHIVRDYGQGRIKWAMAGRDARKLEAVREELSKVDPAAREVPIIIADANDAVAVGNMVSQAQVVLALAGPFAKYGSTIVAQAVEKGTHYCDITGELPWVKRSVVQHNAAAAAKKVKIVHCCGYDSIPSDLGALLLANYCKESLGGKKVAQVYTLAGAKSTIRGKAPTRGGVSGGTIASAFNVLATEPDVAKMATDAYYLAEAAGPQRGTDKPAPFLPTWLPAPATWAGPFVMEGCNAKIVHYSNAIRVEGPYGTDFKYTEMMDGGQGWSGFIKACLVSIGTIFIGLAFSLAPARALLKHVLPKPGEGPSLEVQRTGAWTHRLVGVTQEEPGATPTVVEGECGDNRDPGYWSTSRMILETGLALVLDADAIAASGTCNSGGVLTPATAAGMVLVERLRKAGFTWEITRVTPPAAAK